MTTTDRIYRNPATGYTVRLTDNGRGYAVVTDNRGYRFPMVGADYPFAALLAASRAHLNGATEVPPIAKRIGDMNPSECDAVVREAIAKLNAELNHPAMIAALSEAPVGQMTSPLTADAQSSDGLSAGATLTMPTDAQGRTLQGAATIRGDGQWARIYRGQPCAAAGVATLSTLKAMARRGWLELDHPVRPSYGTVTDAGKRALARWTAARARA